MYFTHLKIYIGLFHFLENGKRMERMMLYWIYKQVKTCNLQVESRSKHQMQRKKQVVLLNQKMKQSVHRLMMR